MTGIGFIGGGAILKSQASVRGTANAASIWLTGAVGAAVAYDLFEIALVLVVINFVTLRWLSSLKKRIRESAGDAPEHEPPLRSQTLAYLPAIVQHCDPSLPTPNPLTPPLKAHKGISLAEA